MLKRTNEPGVLYDDEEHRYRLEKEVDMMNEVDRDDHPSNKDRVVEDGKDSILKAKEWLPHIFSDPDFRAIIEQCDRVLTQKGHDYTRGQKDRLANFYEAANFLGTSAYQTIAVYFYKHLTAIFSFLKHGQVESEPIEGRIVDAINYAMLIFKMVRRETAANKK